ncbi:MAG: class F sortase [Dehalococcoidia bacterium]|nr:class F sortase [Dehalococcoidia bacterium]
MLQRVRPLDRNDLVLALAVVAFLLSVAGLSMTTMRTRPSLPGFARYDRVEVRNEDPEPIAPAVVDLGRHVTDLDPLAAPVSSISIPSISVTANLVPMGVRPDGYMDLPDNPHDVAWYDFTSKPGIGGNGVFSAHVDYINYGPAVFWNLSRVKPGDGIFVGLRDGSTIRYLVTSAETIPLAQLDVGATIAPTEQESITLITCSGEFARGNYSHRVIVRAVRTTSQRGG